MFAPKMLCLYAAIALSVCAGERRPMVVDKYTFQQVQKCATESVGRRDAFRGCFAAAKCSKYAQVIKLRGCQRSCYEDVSNYRNGEYEAMKQCLENINQLTRDYPGQEGTP